MHDLEINNYLVPSTHLDWSSGGRFQGNLNLNLTRQCRIVTRLTTSLSPYPDLKIWNKMGPLANLKKMVNSEIYL